MDFQDLQKQYEDTFLEKGIPGYMVGGLARYVVFGIGPGHFLSGVIANDFLEAVGRADSTNQTRLLEYARVMWNDVPAGCKGSSERLVAWMKQGGLAGQMAEEMKEEA